MIIRDLALLLSLVTSYSNGFQICNPVRRQGVVISNNNNWLEKSPSDGLGCQFGRLGVLQFGSNDNEDKKDDNKDDSREVWVDLKRKVR
jgi:hypothetical protein